MAARQPAEGLSVTVSVISGQGGRQKRRSVRVGGQRQNPRQPEPAPLSQAGGRYLERSRTPREVTDTSQDVRLRTGMPPDTHRTPEATLASRTSPCAPPSPSPSPGPRAAVPLHSLFCPLLTGSSQQRIHEGTSLWGPGATLTGSPGAGIFCLITQHQGKAYDLLGFQHRPTGEVCGLREDPRKSEREKTQRLTWEGWKFGEARTRGSTWHEDI